ncbi:MAG: dienelactone hydrolase family protein [Alphaproteobacteria bacterium]|nr:dienelactone hydrolase family protein [Alphaproteobacteria bacterium]
MNAVLPKPSRRGFVATSLFGGFCLASEPVLAQAITTDTGGLVAGEVKIPVKGGSMAAYRAMPDRAGSFPTVLVVQEIFGVHAHIQDVCRRLAKQGYFAVAPELYFRQGDVSKMTDVQAIIREVVAKVSDEQVMGDLDATVAWARGTRKADTRKLAITGFCWGGRITWMYAAHNQSLKAGVAWYGRVVGQANDMTPKHPSDVVDKINAPVLGLYGGADAGIPNDGVLALGEALTKAGKKSTIIIYPDTPHAFHADYRATYRKDKAEDGWKQLLSWFKSHGVG